MIQRKPSSTLTYCAFVVLSFTFLGCNNLPVQGDYQGNLSVHQATQIVEGEKIPVTVELRYAHHQIRAGIFNANTHEGLMPPLVISKAHSDSVAIEVPGFLGNQSKTFFLKKLKHSTNKCYQSETSSLCVDKDNFNLNIIDSDSKEFHLSGTLFSHQKELALEKPQTLTVAQGVDRIIAKNYDVQEALQVMLRADETAHRAYLSFYPHISVGGALLFSDMVSGGWDDTGKPAMDLVSFIFPGRWILAEAVSWSARAQEVATLLFRLNTGTSIQSMSVAFKAYRALKDELQILQTRMVEVLKISQDLAAQNRLDPNFVFTIEIALADLNVSLWQAQNQFIQSRMSLSKILAFENPEAVEDMILENETTPLEDIPVLSPEDLEAEKRKYAEIGLKNSFELRQLEYLHRAALLNKKNIYYEWLDTNSTLDLGFKLISQSRILDSMIKSVEIKSEKTRQSIIVKAYNLVRDRNLLHQTFDIYNTSLISRRERFDLLLERFHQYANSTDPAAKPIAPSDIRGSVKDVQIGLTGYYSSRAAFTMDQVELDRLALKGVYEQFVPQLNQNEIQE